MSTDSEELEIASDDEDVRRGLTKGVGALGAGTNNADQDPDELSKRDLIRVIANYGKHEQRDISFEMSIHYERMMHFQKAVEELEASILHKREKASKYKRMSKNPDRTIKDLEKIIENNKKKMQELQKEVDAFESKKAKKAVEQKNAQKEINKKLVSQLYKYLEKYSDQVIVKLLETFTALLRNRPTAGREDVELYLRKIEGLQCAMNKLNPRKINGGNAKIYTENVRAIRHHFTDDGSYHKYIPFLVFINQSCAIVLLTIEEKQIEHQIEGLAEENKVKEKEIDEIETFKEHVDEIQDFQAQVDAEVELLKSLKTHHEWLKLRYDKLNHILGAHPLNYDKIDKMDDYSQVKVEKAPVSAGIAKSATKKPETYVSSRDVRAEFEKSDDDEEEESKGQDDAASDDEEGEDEEADDNEEEGDDEEADDDASEEVGASEEPSGTHYSTARDEPDDEEED